MSIPLEPSDDSIRGTDPDLAGDGDLIEITDADLPSDAYLDAIALSDGMFRRPSIGPALIWTFLLLASQIAIGLVMTMAAMVYVIATQPGPVDPNRLSKLIESAMQGWLLPVASFSTLVVSFTVVLSLFRRQTARCMGLRGLTATQATLILLLALPMTVLTSEFTNWVSYLFPRMAMPAIFGDLAKQPWLLIFVAGCLFPGIGEELFFRGFLSRGLLSYHGAFWGTFFAAFLFGAVHIHPIQASGAFLLGLALQFVFLTTRSLWGAVILHTANNTLAFAAMRYGHLVPINGFTVAAEDRIVHSPALLVLVALSTSTMLLWALGRSRTQWIRPDGTVWSRGFVTTESPFDDSNVRIQHGSVGIMGIVGVLVAYGIFAATLYYSIER